MNIHRQIYPIGIRNAAGLALQPLSERHVQLLDLIGSPLFHAAAILNGKTENADEHLEQFRARYQQTDIRPTVAILCTSEKNLHTLDKVSPDQFEKAVSESIPELSDPALNALAWALCAMHFAAYIERLKTASAQPN